MPMRREGERRREEGNGLMKKRQCKVSVGGLPSLLEKYHAHITLTPTPARRIPHGTGMSAKR